MQGSFCRPMEFSAKQIILPNDRTVVLELGMLLCTFDARDDEDDEDDNEEKEEEEDKDDDDEDEVETAEVADDKNEGGIE